MPKLSHENASRSIYFRREGKDRIIVSAQHIPEWSVSVGPVHGTFAMTKAAADICHQLEIGVEVILRSSQGVRVISSQANPFMAVWEAAPKYAGMERIIDFNKRPRPALDGVFEPRLE